MKIKDLIAQVRASMAKKLEERNTHRSTIDTVRTACAEAANRALTDDEAAQVRAAQDAIAAIDDELRVMQEQIAEYEAEQARDEAADRLAREVGPGAPVPGSPERVQVTGEPRTYSREKDPKGLAFMRDLALSVVRNDGTAGARLARHMDEERVERGAAIAAGLEERAVGTGAFAGLVVPQYLVDLYAPNAKAGRPFADACRKHDLPEQGMVVNLSKITTGSSSAIQANEGDAVSETNMDDTLLSINVQTNSGQQTSSLQGIERGAGIEDTIVEDLFRSYNTTLDSTLINQATTGLTNVATAIAYTDATPTAAELYPKLLQAPAAMEALLLDMDPGDGIAVMHSRRWFWLQSQLSSTWPLFGQPSVPAQLSGVNYGERYGSGFRGVLPNGTPVIVDNNIATNLGAGTNEDEIYFIAQSEAHLWEDPAAPVFIRAEQTKAANLQVLFVVYGYFAYTFTRRAHAQKINGTGLVTPTF
jgi:hypothetical protein